MYQEDRLFRKKQPKISAFEFDEKVACVFSDMIQRSVPGYSSILSGIRLIAPRFAQPQTHLYDLGCSLGAAMLAMATGAQEKNCRLIGIDNSQAMLNRAQTVLNECDVNVPYELKLDDVTQTNIEHASVVVLNFTLQFIPPAKRLMLLKNIFNGLQPGGILIISEKFRQSKPWCQQLLTDLHLDFKRMNGYNELEISQKRAALESVMHPDTFDQHKQNLSTAGFSYISFWYQCFNFGSLIAIK